MSRTLPLDCKHGVTVDWGDFGPCQDCDDHPGEDCPNLGDCELCDAEQETPLQRASREVTEQQDAAAEQGEQP